MWKVMLADDEPFVRDGLEKLIPWKELGYELKGCYRNGKVLLEEIPDIRPDLVILDIQMPIMGGLETSKIIQQQYPEITTMLLTAYAEFGYAQEAIKNGVRGYVLKSNLLEDLPKELAGLQAVLEEKEQRRLVSEKLKEFMGNVDTEKKSEIELEDTLSYSDQVISDVRQYVSEHLTEKLVLNDIAEAVHMNRSYLSRIYKQKTGENLFDMINRMRIDKAKEYLKYGNMKLYEIGYKIGLDDTAYFSKLFKKYEGCSPREFESRMR